MKIEEPERLYLFMTEDEKYIGYHNRYDDFSADNRQTKSFLSMSKGQCTDLIFEDFKFGLMELTIAPRNVFIMSRELKDVAHAIKRYNEKVFLKLKLVKFNYSFEMIEGPTEMIYCLDEFT